MMKLAVLGGALLVATAQMVWAAEDCGAKTNQMDMNICAGKAYKKSDEELNKVYKQLQTRLKADASRGKLLVSAQRAWIGYRDAQCKFTGAGSVGGSVYSFLHSSCLTELTNSRIADLNGNLECAEGDITCPASAAN